MSDFFREMISTDKNSIYGQTFKLHYATESTLFILLLTKLSLYKIPNLAIGRKILKVYFDLKCQSLNLKIGPNQFLTFYAFQRTFGVGGLGCLVITRLMKYRFLNCPLNHNMSLCREKPNNIFPLCKFRHNLFLEYCAHKELRVRPFEVIYFLCKG